MNNSSNISKMKGAGIEHRSSVFICHLSSIYHKSKMVSFTIIDDDSSPSQISLNLNTKQFQAFLAEEHLQGDPFKITIHPKTIDEVYLLSSARVHHSHPLDKNINLEPLDFDYDDLLKRIGPTPISLISILKSSTKPETQKEFLRHDISKKRACDPYSAKTLHHALIAGADNCNFNTVNDFAEVLISGKLQANGETVMDFNLHNYPDSKECIEAWRLGAYHKLNPQEARAASIPAHSLHEAMVISLHNGVHSPQIILRGTFGPARTLVEIPCNLSHSSDLGRLVAFGLKQGDLIRFATTNPKWHGPFFLPKLKEPFPFLGDDMPGLKLLNRGRQTLNHINLTH